MPNYTENVVVWSVNTRDNDTAPNNGISFAPTLHTEYAIFRPFIVKLTVYFEQYATGTAAAFRLKISEYFSCSCSMHTRLCAYHARSTMIRHNRTRDDANVESITTMSMGGYEIFFALPMMLPCICTYQKRFRAKTFRHSMETCFSTRQNI